MFLTLTIVLALALLIALARIVQHRRATRALTQALLSERTWSVEKLSGASSRNWRELLQEINDLIAENQRLQRLRSGQLAQLEATLGSLQEAVLIIDRNNTILLANKSLQSIFPNATAALHQRFERVIHSAAFLEYGEAVRASIAPPQHEIAFIMPHETRWLEVTGTTIPTDDDTEGPWSLFVLHDITRQKKLEAVRKEFVANVSHELRTPLSLVKGCAETLVDGHLDMPVDDRDRFLRTIQRHSERLNSLIEDLLSLSRLESTNPGLQLERVSFPQLVTTLVDDYRARPAAAKHHITATIDPAIGNMNLDSRKIAQVLENFIENAVKYTPPGSHIDINARPSATAKREIEVSVHDNGPGIPATDLPHIFERFYRVDKGRARDSGGTGLGLSIVKHIVQLHGGRVRVESEQGHGTTFYFTLPA